MISEIKPSEFQLKFGIEWSFPFVLRSSQIVKKIFVYICVNHEEGFSLFLLPTLFKYSILKT